ncbi:MAG TPA: tetratricopeptide repeat protein, partial [bacterium]|nr:tetratricopeptide repeat protein [bacterium]
EKFYDTEKAVEARLQLAAIYQSQSKYPIAWNELDKAMHASPAESQRGRILFARAEVAQHRWGPRRAMEIYNQLWNDFRNDEIGNRAALEMAALAITQRDYDRADEIYAKVEKVQTESIKLQALENHGDLYWTQEEYESARDYYKQAMDLLPQPSARDTLWIKYALALERSGSLKPANVQLGELVKPGTSGISEPILRTAYDHLARTSRHLEHYAEAVTALQNLLTVTSEEEHAAVYQRIGDIYYTNLREYPQAERAYTAVIDSFPYFEDIDEVLYSLGRTEIATGKYREAGSRFERVIEQYPYSARRSEAQDQLWYIQHFYNRDQQLSFQKLASLFGDLLLERNRQDIFFNLGKLYFQYQQDYPAALEQFRELESFSNLSPAVRDSLTWYIAESYRILAQGAKIEDQSDQFTEYRQQALAQYEKYLESGSARGDTRNLTLFYLGELSAESDPEAALDYFSNLQNVEDFAVLASVKMAEIYRQQENYSRAISLLQKTILNYDYTNDPNYAGAVAFAADIAADDGQRELASNYYNRYLRLESDGPAAARANWQLLQLSVEGGQFQQARQYAAVLKQDAFYSPYASQVDNQLGQILMESGDYESAATWYQNLAESASPLQGFFIGAAPEQNTEAIYWTGFAYARLDQLSAAERYFRWYTQEGNNTQYLAEAYQHLARIANTEEDYEEARGFYLQAAGLLENSDETLQLEVRAANMLFELQRYKEVADELKTLSQSLSPPERYDVWEQAVTARIRGGDIRNADSEIEALTKAAKLKENALPRLTFRYETSRMLAENKKYEESVGILKELLAQDLPAEFETKVKYELGRQYGITNRYEEAIDLLTGLTVNNPGSPMIAQIYVTLGTVLNELNQPGNAIEAFRNALDHGATGTYRRNAMNNLIALYENTGIWQSAVSMARQYVQEFPNAEDAFSTRIQIGVYLKNMREYSRALEHFSALLGEADSESSAEIQFQIGETYFEQNQYKQAITEYLKVPYLNPNTRLPWDTTALYKAGNAYEHLGQNDQAINLYERIIEKEGASSNYGRFARRRINELLAQQQTP